MFIELVRRGGRGGTKIFAVGAAALVLAPAAPPAVEELLSSARALQAAGKLEQARAVYERALPELSRPGNEARLYEACSELSAIDTALGNYAAAVERADQAVRLAERLQDFAAKAKALNRAGSARLYEARYAAALDYFQQALQIDRSLGDAEGQVLRLNNIGNVHFFEGRYMEALKSYREAQQILDLKADPPWRRRWGYATAVNIATVWQRLGQHEKALDVYLSLKSSAGAVSPREQARLLGNLGAAYRRLGDPIKALESYREAQRLFAREKDLDGELGVLKNMGIAIALDLKDYAAALGVFDEVAAVAGRAGNRREETQARLYRGEALGRLGRWGEAEAEFRKALAAAEAMGTVEEQWKALYGIGRAEEHLGRPGRAWRQYEEALNRIESLRGGLGQTSLKTRFLADKRDVYDALIRLRLGSAAGGASLAEEIFRWVERARARTLQDQLARDSRFLPSLPMASGWAEPPELRTIQEAIDERTAVLVFWVAETGGAVIWITRDRAGVEPVAWSVRLEEQVRLLAMGLSRGPGFDPRSLAEVLGEALLDEIPALADPRIQNLGIVPDGVMHVTPFEVFPVRDPEGERKALVERFNVFYLPSTAILLRPVGKRLLFPWSTTLVALANPAGSGEGAPALPFSAHEARAISRRIPGRAKLYVGADARKAAIIEGDLTGVPLVHLAAHAVVAEEDAERSRLVLAPEQSSGGASFLYVAEVPRLDLNGVELVTVPACETERGRFVRGEGVENFSRAFLLAGAEATVTTLWKVADEPTAAFMDQFYYFLSRGMPKAEALRQAKLKFLRSETELAQPYYWAAFILNGDGRRAVGLPHPWSWWLGGAAILGLLLFSGAALRRRY